MPEILYFNGRRVAMGDDLEPVVLFDDAKPGDKVTVAVKLLHTVDKKSFRGATLRIDFPESRPNPEDLRHEFLSAALLVPSLAPSDASQMALSTTPSTPSISPRSMPPLPLTQLHAPRPRKSSTPASAPRTETRSPHAAAADRPLSISPATRTSMRPGCGRGPRPSTWCKRTFGTALQLMYEYPQYTYTQIAPRPTTSGWRRSIPT